MKKLLSYKLQTVYKVLTWVLARRLYFLNNKRQRSRNTCQGIRELKLYELLSNVDTAPGIANTATIKESLNQWAVGDTSVGENSPLRNPLREALREHLSLFEPAVELTK